jgi:T5SS/PEP-CTERM-associated repeat protein
MKKLITLFAIAGLVLALAPAAQAAITGTPWLSNMPHTGTTDWIIGNIDSSYGSGSLEVAGGSLLDMNGSALNLGWGAGTSTITVTGPGSKILADNGFTVGGNGTSDLIITNGGWVAATKTDRSLEITKSGTGTVLVTGDGSKLTSINGQIVVGMYVNLIGLLTVEDSGLVQANNIKMGFDGNNCEGYIHMAAGGVLAVEGDKTTNPFLPNGMFTTGPGTAIGEIQYLNGSTWENMTGAAAALYDLTYYSSGGPTVNGQVLTGYTVLTMAGGAPVATPGTVFIIQ